MPRVAWVTDSPGGPVGVRLTATGAWIITVQPAGEDALLVAEPMHRSVFPARSANVEALDGSRAGTVLDASLRLGNFDANRVTVGRAASR